MNFINQNYLLVALAILAIINVVMLILYFRLRTRMNKFLIGFDSENISHSLSHVSTNLDDIQKFRKEMEVYLADVEKRLRKSVQSVHTVRFNPFKGTGEGGNQSFATAFLNENGDGVVISSLYSREKVSIFAKPIKNNSSEHELSEEEKEALKSAKLGL